MVSALRRNRATNPSQPTTYSSLRKMSLHDPSEVFFWPSCSTSRASRSLCVASSSRQNLQRVIQLTIGTAASAKGSDWYRRVATSNAPAEMAVTFLIATSNRTNVSMSRSTGVFFILFPHRTAGLHDGQAPSPLINCLLELNHQRQQ